MKNQTGILAGGIAVVLALFGSTLARADSLSVTATLTGVAYDGVLVTLGLNDGAGHTESVTGIAGEYQWTQNSGSYVLGKAGSFSTFCIEITQDVSLNTQYGYELASLQTSPQPTPNYWIPTNGMGSADATKIEQLWTADYSNVDNAATAAAFQFAIWKIIYGSQLTFSGGSAVSSDLTLANSWLTALPANEADANVVALSSSYTNSPNPGSQDQITAAPSGYSSAPLPATALSGGVLLFCLGILATIRRMGRWSSVRPAAITPPTP